MSTSVIPKPHLLTQQEVQAFAPPPPNFKKGYKDLKTVMSLLPLERIPTCLKTSPNPRLRPPLFRLGYAVTDRWAADYARKFGLEGGFEEVEYESDDDNVDEDEDQISGSSRPKRAELPPPIHSQFDRVEVGCSFAKILQHINDYCGSETLHVTIETILPLPCYLYGRTYYYLLCIGTSNTARDGPLPTPEDVMRFAAHLQMKEPLGWYLDAIEGYWEKRVAK